MFDEFTDDKPFMCRVCGEVCSEDEWNDDDICDGCFDEAAQAVTDVIRRKDDSHQFKKFKKNGGTTK